MQIIKIGSDLCPICGLMSSFDKETIEGLGYELVTVDSEELEQHPRLLQFLLNNLEEDLVLPTYVNLDERKILEGGSGKDSFRRKVEELLLPRFTVGAESDELFPLTKKRLELEVFFYLSSRGEPVTPPIESSLGEGEYSSFVVRWESKGRTKNEKFISLPEWGYFFAG